MTNDKRTDHGLYWDRAWTLVEGCSKVSPGCDNCWAETQAAMRQNHPNPKVREPLAGMIDEYGGGWSGVIRLRYDNLQVPLKATAPKVWSIWNDLFHEDVPIQFASQAFEVMLQAPQHTFLILTKRPERMLQFMNRWEWIEARRFDFQNVWLGITTETQETADQRIPHLLSCNAHRFLSIEPMLRNIDITKWLWRCSVCGESPMSNDISRWRWTGELWQHHHDYPVGHVNCRLSNALDWVIVGTETGPHRRPAKIEWIRNLAFQCKTSRVPIFIKKLEIDGRATADMSLWPEDLRIRQYPEGMKIEKEASDG